MGARSNKIMIVILDKNHCLYIWLYIGVLKVEKPNNIYSFRAERPKHPKVETLVSSYGNLGHPNP